MKLDFGINPKDYRPQTPCDRCGIIDASVKKWGNKLPCECGEVPLCEDCFNFHSDEIVTDIIESMLKD